MIDNERWEMIRDLLETIEQSYNVGCTDLTSWEVEFYDSVSIQFSSRDDLSDKQIAILKKILEKE